MIFQHISRGYYDYVENQTIFKEGPQSSFRVEALL